MTSGVRATPSRVGKYELKAVIARTAQSVVYDGWDGNIARRVAIKLIPLLQDDDETARDILRRFKRGAQTAGQLSHRNIVAVYDYGETEDCAYLVMEFIDGPTLKTLFDNNRRFTSGEIGAFVGGILDALQYSHDRKVVHRDIKPANVMLAADNTVKITDFGIARLEDSDMTQAGMVIGTPAYMSPEQFLGEKVDLRTDIYSTGVLLYNILTGERPYEGTLATIMHKVLYGAPLLPSRLSTSVTPALDQVVTRAMARNREDRFESAAHFKAELLKALKSANVAPGRPILPKAQRAPLARTSSYAFPREILFGGLVVLALGAAGGIVWHLLSGPDTARVSDGRQAGLADVPASPSPSPAAVAPPPAETTPVQPPVEQANATGAPPPEIQNQPTVVPPEAKPPEQDSSQLPPVSAPVGSPRDAGPFSTPAIDNPAEKKPPVRQPKPKTSTGGSMSAMAPPDKRGSSPVPRSHEPPASPEDRSGKHTPPTEASATNDALHRPHNGMASLATRPADPVAPPSSFPITSSSAIGLFCQSVTTESAGELGLDGAHGMVVMGVTSGSAAAMAGIRQRDVILKVNGTEIRDLSALSKIAADTPSGAAVPVEIFRHGDRQVVQLQVDDLRH